VDFPSLSSEARTLLNESTLNHEITPSHIALNFLIWNKNITTILETVHKKRINANRESSGWNLTNDEIERINIIFHTPRSKFPMIHSSQVNTGGKKWRYPVDDAMT